MPPRLASVTSRIAGKLTIARRKYDAMQEIPETSTLKSPWGFFAGMAGVIAIRIAVQSLGLLDSLGLLTPDHLNTTLGLKHRDDPLTRELLAINFPGYQDEIERIGPQLSETSQFSEPHQLLADGRRVKFNIPRYLPFILAASKPPDVIILGTSRARDGVRPDKLGEALGGATVLNFAFSGARFTTTEVILDTLKKLVAGPIEYVVVSVDDVSFMADDGETRLWRDLLKKFEARRTIVGDLSWRVSKFYDFFPKIQRNRMLPPSQPFRSCANEALMQKLEARSPPPGETYLGPPAPEQIRAFDRVAIMARELGRKVLFVEMPTTEYQKRRMPNFDFRSHVAATLGNAFVSQDLEGWGLFFRSFLGAKTLEPCEPDPSHLNPAAAIGFTKRLAHLFK